MSKQESEANKKNFPKLTNELTIKEHLNAEKMLIKRLSQRKKAYKEFLVQIEDFIEHAREQAKNNDNRKLRLKYLEMIGEEESLRDKIKEYLKKNNELIESLQK